MNPIDYLTVAVIAIVLLSAGRYLYRSKKKGKKCVGCPYSGSCGGTCGK